MGSTCSDPARESLTEIQLNNLDGVKQKPEHHYSNGEIYKGEWKGKLRHGKGELRRKNGFTYEGDWRYDMAHGQGTAKYPGGAKYTG